MASAGDRAGEAPSPHQDAFREAFAEGRDAHADVEGSGDEYNSYGEEDEDGYRVDDVMAQMLGENIEGSGDEWGIEDEGAMPGYAHRLAAAGLGSVAVGHVDGSTSVVGMNQDTLAYVSTRPAAHS